MTKPTTIEEIIYHTKHKGYSDEWVVTGDAKAELATLLRSVVPTDINNTELWIMQRLKHPDDPTKVTQDAFYSGAIQAINQINQAINKIVGDV